MDNMSFKVFNGSFKKYLLDKGLNLRLWRACAILNLYKRWRKFYFPEDVKHMILIIVIVTSRRHDFNSYHYRVHSSKIIDHFLSCHFNSLFSNLVLHLNEDITYIYWVWLLQNVLNLPSTSHYGLSDFLLVFMHLVTILRAFFLCESYDTYNFRGFHNMMLATLTSLCVWICITLNPS